MNSILWLSRVNPNGLQMRRQYTVFPVSWSFNDCFGLPGFLSIYQVLVVPKSFGHILHYSAGQVEYFQNLHHKAQKILVKRPEWKTLFGRHKQRWESNIKICLKEIGNKNVV